MDWQSGPLTKHWPADRWKQHVITHRAARERLRHLPPVPLVSPPALRRRLALLWFISTALDGQMEIGWMYRPPMTDDMRWLISRGYLRVERIAVLENSAARMTRLLVTELGRHASEAARLRSPDHCWIEAAYAHGMLA